MIVSALKFIGKVLSALFVLSIVAVILLRFINPPITVFQLARTLEQYGEGKPIKLTKRWVPLNDIAKNLQEAVIAGEDNRFYEHYGFDFQAIDKAAEHNRLSKEKRGASTITQQTAKNVFLWPARTWLRKGLEAYFTLLLELFWSKNRILEVYLNVIEVGDGLYGAEVASNAYFSRPAARLTLNEACLIAAALPAPRKFSPARPDAYLRARARLIQQIIYTLRTQHPEDQI